MARIRTIKPEFWTSEQVMSVGRDVRLLFIGMWNFADDHGVIPFNPKTIKAQVFPGDDDVNSALVRRWLDELWAKDLIGVFEQNGKEYIVITGWKHQKIDKPTYKHPDPSRCKTRPFPSRSPTIPGMLAEPSPPEGIVKEGNGSERNSEAKASDADASPPAAQKPKTELSEVSNADGARQATTQNDLLEIPLMSLRPPNGDWAKLVFGEGLAWLQRITGAKESQTRSLVGRMRKLLGNDDRALMDIMGRCQAQPQGIERPHEWILAAIAKRNEMSRPLAGTNGKLRPYGDTTPFQAAVSAWEAGGRAGPAPKLEDFQGAST